MAEQPDSLGRSAGYDRNGSQSLAVNGVNGISGFLSTPPIPYERKTKPLIPLTPLTRGP
jgi:hypothetical protein